MSDLPRRSVSRRAGAGGGALTRRTVLGGGLSAVMLGALRMSGRAAPGRSGPGRQTPAPPALPEALRASRPFAEVPFDPPSIQVGGYPFAEGFTGDPWSFGDMPFHTGETDFPGGEPPRPEESVEVAIVGGGLSGLSTAYFLRHRKPVLFELRPRFGGVAQGEIWGGTHTSLGSAYFITPDKGSFLEDFYAELGLDRVARVSWPEDDLTEVDGVLIEDFFAGAGLSGAELIAFERYARIVRYYANQAYPEIPLPNRDYEWIVELDELTLREDLEAKMGGPLPQVLAAAIQAYCYSSFNAGWEEISAAMGWNFIAAEEFGRWVCPGGNTWVVDELWRRVALDYAPEHLDRLRPDTRVVDVRQADDGRMQVTWRDAEGAFRSLLAERVVMACSKHICKYMLHDLETIDPLRRDAMHQVVTTPYLIVNVLLKRPFEAGWYDAFLLGEDFPMMAHSPEASARFIDVIQGHYASETPGPTSILTLYWPIPSPEVMFEVLIDSAWDTYTQRIIPHLDRMLRLLDIAREDVQQVRFARWGHAMPVSSAGFIAHGHAKKLRSPYLGDRVWFVNQDNWASPAFETCVLEAREFATVIDEAL